MLIIRRMNCINTISGIRVLSLYVGDRKVCKFGWNIQTCTLYGHVHRVTYIRCRINTIDSPDDEHRGARNIYRTGINIYEKRLVRQIGYLQEIIGVNF